MKTIRDFIVVGATEWSYLIVVVACIGATTIVAAADSSAGRRHCIGPLHEAARLWKGEGSRRLWRWVMNVVDEVVTIAVAVAVQRAAGLLRGRCLQAA